MQDINRAQFAMLSSTFLWGLAPIFVEMALQYCTPLFIMTMRFGLIFLKNRTCILIGWLISCGYLLSTLGQDLTTAGLATLLSTSYIVMVPFMSWKLGKNKITKGIIALSCITLLGMFLITFNGDWENFSSITSIGTLFLVSAAFVWGLNIVLTDKFISDTKSETGRFDYLSFLYASIFHTFLPLFALSLLESLPKYSVFLKILPLVVLLGVFTTVLTFGLYQYALSKMGSVNTTFYLLLQILVPFSYEILIIKMSYSMWIVSGSLIILLSILIRETNALKRVANLVQRTSEKELQILPIIITSDESLH
ncbi:MAG: DMT family transporter [Candidatus Hodarchaeales archaeon]|jgi:drug/metabolite transporter (DMT)-like permease